MNKDSGIYVKNLSGDLAYQSFRPADLEPVGLDELAPKDQKLLKECHKGLADLRGKYRAMHAAWSMAMEEEYEQGYYLEIFPRWIAPSLDLIYKEALFSLNMDGNPAKSDDIEKIYEYREEDLPISLMEIDNYREALVKSRNLLKSLPFSGRLMKEIHAILMESVTSPKRYPGQFRRTQNWLGPQGSTIKTARYIPPNPHDMVQAISALEKFVNYNRTTDPLIVAALINYQLEVIQPFLDGGSRIARIMPLLYLMEAGIIEDFIPPISKFFSRSQLAYHMGLDIVRKHGDYGQWIGFYLEVMSQAVIDANTLLDSSF